MCSSLTEGYIFHVINNKLPIWGPSFWPFKQLVVALNMSITVFNQQWPPIKDGDFIESVVTLIADHNHIKVLCYTDWLYLIM